MGNHRKRLKARARGATPSMIVGVGASAGGVDAFLELLKHLPVDTGLAYVFLLHLNPAQESHLTEILSRATRMPVREAADGALLEADSVYVMPPNVDLSVSGGRLKLRPKGGGKRGSIDGFFHSLAEDQKSRAVGVVLSGMASDGTIGLEEIKAAGGVTLVQDEKSAGYSGMPHSAVAAGCADFALPPKGIARELARLGRHPLLREGGDQGPFSDEASLAAIFALLRASSGVDFSAYKPSTVCRRIARRMFLLNLSRLRDYLGQLKRSPEEAHALYNDLLINVTSFFRDPKVFEALKRKVFPQIVRGRGLDAPVRIWTAGCSTGEEAYSLAISYLEFLRERGAAVPAHIFATDISEVSLAKARKGFYPEGIAASVSPELLSLYFVKTGGGYQVSKRLRDMCIFARHDVTADPPFANQDLISCRNLLIYLEPALQKTVLATFHYALQPGGFLLLGGAETVGSPSDLFAETDKALKIYSKRPSRAARPPFAAARPGGRRAPAAPLARAARAPSADPLSVADRLALRLFAPSGVVVGRDLDILQFRGDTSRYLRTAPGKASLNLLKMAPESMRLDLQLLVKKAFQGHAPVRKTGVWVRLDRRSRPISLEALSFDVPPAKERYCLVSFLPAAAASASAPRPAKEPRDGLFQKLKRELAETKGYLQSRIDEAEIRNAELNIANEEVISSNEELQSTNEELESSREELQTANEELNTLNDELRKQNAALIQLGGDLDNILESLDIPIAILGLDLRIRRVTLMEHTPLALTAADVGRSILDIQKKLGLADLEEMALEVIKRSTTREVEVAAKDGRWYKLRIRPYKTARSKAAEGVVLALLDADVAKRALLQLKDVLDQSLVILDSNLRVQSANRCFYDYFMLSPKLTQGKPLNEVSGGRWNSPRLHAKLLDALADGRPFHDVEVEIRHPNLGQRRLRFGGVRVPDEGRAATTLFLTISDITDVRRAETVKALEERERTQREFIANVSHELRTPVTAIKGYAQTLQQGGLDDKKHRMSFVNTIDRHADRLTRLISDLLRISTLAERPAPRPRKVRVADVVRRCVAELAPAAKAARVAIRGRLPAALTVSADRGQLADVVSHLLANAVKFNRPGGSVTIAARAGKREAVIVVEDTGVGIPEKDLPRIFERFYRGGNARTRQGAGLGLSIAQQIVAAHGGRIWAENRPGRGAAFHFTMPLWPR